MTSQNKGMRKFSLGTLSVFLSILMIVYLIPLSVYADLAPTIEGNEDTTTQTEQTEQITEEPQAPDAMFELTDRREQNVKHFRLSDGSIVAAQYASPIHEQDENGEWQDIDNTLGDSGNEYATPNARVKFAKKITGNQSLFTLHDGKYKIAMSLDGAIKKTTGSVTNTQTEFDENATQLQKMMTLDKLSAKIMYADILDGVDLEYVLESVNIKENIIVKEKKDSYTYTFTLDLNNLTATLQQDGSIHITDPDSGEVKYRMPAPVVYDAAGVTASASLSAYTLTKTGNHTYALTVTVNADWMNDEEREFPVTVDPTISEATASTGIDTYVDSDNPTATYYGYSFLAAGTGAAEQEFVTYWKINTLPTIPNNSYITSANLRLYCQDFRLHSSDTSMLMLGAYHVTSAWNSINYNQMTAESQGKLGALLDYVKVYTTNEGQYVSWDITVAVKGWYENNSSNHGIAIRQLRELQSDALFDSFNKSGGHLPMLTLSYRDMKGMESYWSSTSHSAGLAGSGSVNTATGNLTFAIGTLTTTDALFAYTPTLVYNSANANLYNTNTYNSNIPYKYLSTGYGLKLNYQETVMPITLTDETGSATEYYVWSDSDGTEHYFYDDDNDGVFNDEDGLQMTLTCNATSYIIEDTVSKTVRTFKIYSDSTNIKPRGGVLESITDKYGNMLVLTLNQKGQPTKISVQPNGQTAIDFLTLSYNGLNALYEIKNETSGQVVTLYYNTAFNYHPDFISPIYAGPLCKVEYSHMSGTTKVTDATMEYTYAVGADNVYRLASVKDTMSNVSIVYTYDAGKIVSIQEYGGTIAGQKLTYTYGSGYTEIRNSGSDDVHGNTDDLITHYSFDHQGRAANVYSTNLNRNIIYGATAGAYESDNENAKNSLKNTIVIGGEATNYIHNGGFESLTSENKFIGWTQTDDVIYNNHFKAGSRRAQITIYENDQESLSQRLTLPTGEYTLSMECCATYCAGVTATMRVKSLTAGSSQNETKELSVNCTGEFDEFVSSPALTFISDGGAYEISIETTGTDGVLYIDNIMLEENIGASSYGMLEFGSFEETEASSGSTTVTYSPITYWNNISSGYAELTESDNSLFGQSVSIIGSMDMDKWTYQRVNVVSDNAYAMTKNNPRIYPNVYKSRTFAISGFAKGTQQVPNPDTSFCLSINIQYHDGPLQNEVFEFNKDLTDWQYILGSFSTQEGYAIDYIQVECKYSYQPGVAYFDDINLFEVKDSSAASYIYYDNGLPKYMVTPSYSEYYAYNDNGDVIETVTSDGYASDYVYNGMTLSSVTTSTYAFESTDANEDENEDAQVNYTIFNYGEKDSASFKDIVKTNIAKTEYSINSYGLPTATVSYAFDENGVATSKLHSTTTYYQSLGCPIFGHVKSETNTAGQTTSYVYDQNKGLLTYTQSGTSGLYYTYDALGRMTNVTPILYMGAATPLPQEDVENLTYTYDQNGRVSTIATDSTTYTFTYDKFGNTKSIKAGTATLATYNYADNNGKLQSMTYGNGIIAKYFYDELDRVVEICYANSSDITLDKYTYTYRADGRLHTVESTASKRGYEYNYDAKGQLTGYQEYDTETKSRLLAIGQVFDQDGKLTGAQYGVGYKQGSNTLVGYLDYTYKYNSLDELESVKLVLEDYETEINREYDYDDLHRLSSITTSYGTAFNRTENYGYRNRNSPYTTTQISNYTSTVNGTSTEYAYTYDEYGNITSITDSAGKVTKYYYDDLQQLVREDNPYYNQTYVYKYDNAGNRTSKEFYGYTTESTISSYPNLTLSYIYEGDRLVRCVGLGSDNTYDGLGNPLTYSTGLSTATFTWQNGRQLATATKGSTSVSYKYNDSGIRTSKTVNGVEHIYTLNGSQIVSESWGNNTLVYLYDETGSPIGMQYRTSSMAEGVFVNFFFEKNLFGDIVGVYNESGIKVLSYYYDAWGNHTPNVLNSTGNNTYAQYNPFRYRGYYFDTETEFYYLQSRYYDPGTGRFLNADGYVNANGDLIGFNMYAYCSNNPVMYVDPAGSSAVFTLSSKHEACAFNPDSVGGGGGVIVPLFYNIKTIWTVSKSLLITLSAQVTLLGAALSSVFSDSLSTSTSMEEALAESASKRNDPDAIYIGIVIEDNLIYPVTSAMTFEEAYNWAMNTSTSYEYSRKTSWGLYTPQKSDAKFMASQLALSKGLIGDPQIDINLPQGQYEHYHVPGRKFGRYKHFHVWYGLPVE